jgi:diaminohydroxyphosphoribosylaminopyrimidine deaminase / 5-amino-6-(5-phosphoribosylamino)uracil reductase
MIYDKLMKRVMELARKGTGFVSPNPRVGALIIKDGKIISEGWHSAFGKSHAEVNAINNAKGIDLTGATLVVNLEPCSHTGKTPPCTDLIIEKKFAKVVVAMQDPNPLVAGKGIKKLRDAGIEVETGVLEEEARWLNRTFIKHITTGMPYIVLKVAQSLDGKIATSTGESKWITCEESRKYSHKLRAEFDAVLVGKNTIVEDNPELNVRHVKGRDPFRVILDSNLSLSTNYKVFNNKVKTIVCCSQIASETKKANEFKKAGIEIIPSEVDESKRIDLKDCLRKLSKEHNIASVFVEGGSVIFSSFAKANLIDELHLFVAPKIIGNGKDPFGKFEIKNLSNAREFEIKEIERIGRDLHIVLKMKH